MIVLSESGSLFGWDLMLSAEGKFPMVTNDIAEVGNTGGSIEHSHSSEGVTEACDGREWGRTGSAALASYLHAHSYSFSTGIASNIPPSINILFLRLNSVGTITNEIILGCTDLPPLGWRNVEYLNNIFPRASLLFNSTVEGYDYHDHEFSFTTGQPSLSRNVLQEMGYFCSSIVHTHSVVGKTDAAGLPAYFGLQFIRRIDNTYEGKLSIIIEEEEVLK